MGESDTIRAFTAELLDRKYAEQNGIRYQPQRRKDVVGVGGGGGGGTGGGGQSSKGGGGDGWEKIAAPANSQGSQGGGGGGGGGAGVAAAKAGKGKKGVGSAFDALMGAQ